MEMCITLVANMTMNHGFLGNMTFEYMFNGLVYCIRENLLVEALYVMEKSMVSGSDLISLKAIH